MGHNKAAEEKRENERDQVVELVVTRTTLRSRQNTTEGHDLRLGQNPKNHVGLAFQSPGAEDPAASIRCQVTRLFSYVKVSRFCFTGCLGEVRVSLSLSLLLIYGEYFFFVLMMQ